MVFEILGGGHGADEVEQGVGEGKVDEHLRALKDEAGDSQQCDGVGAHGSGGEQAIVDAGTAYDPPKQGGGDEDDDAGGDGELVLS